MTRESRTISHSQPSAELFFSCLFNGDFDHSSDADNRLDLIDSLSLLYQFVGFWNAFFCENKPEHKDYIQWKGKGIPNNLIGQIKACHDLNTAIKEKVEEKLKSDFVGTESDKYEGLFGLLTSGDSGLKCNIDKLMKIGKFNSKMKKIHARGNGSCGPNSLGIIFCSYLLSDQFGDLSDLQKPVVFLNEFAHCWNVYYCSNDSGHDDYIKFVDELDAITILDKTEEQYQAEIDMGLRQLNVEIKSKVSQKLESMAKRFGGYRSEHMQQLIAPLVRFAYNFELRVEDGQILRNIVRLTPYQSNYGGFFEYLFSKSDLDKDEKQYAYQFGLFFSNWTKQDMVEKKRVFRTVEGTRTSDNSPDFSSFFNQEGTEYAGKLLGLQPEFLCRDRLRVHFHDEQMPCADGQNQIRTSGIKPKQLFCIVTNMSGFHFDAMLPKFVIEHPEVAPFFMKSDDAHFLQDKEAYGFQVLSKINQDFVKKFSKFQPEYLEQYQEAFKKEEKPVRTKKVEFKLLNIKESGPEEELIPASVFQSDIAPQFLNPSHSLTEGSSKKSLNETSNTEIYLKGIVSVILLAVGFVFIPLMTLGVLGMLWITFSAKTAYEIATSDMKNSLFTHSDQLKNSQRFDLIHPGKKPDLGLSSDLIAKP